MEQVADVVLHACHDGGHVRRLDHRLPHVGAGGPSMQGWQGADGLGGGGRTAAPPTRPGLRHVVGPPGAKWRSRLRTTYSPLPCRSSTSPGGRPPCGAGGGGPGPTAGVHDNLGTWRDRGVAG